MKTKETSVCSKCGGIGKPSKGFMNFHNIQTQDLSKEFETKLLDCIKCESCGHSWIPEISKEEKLAWFNNQIAGNKASLVNYYLGKTDYIAKDHEIELIYDAEHSYKAVINPISTKEQAMAWWNQLTSFQRSYFKDLYIGERSLSNLTNKEMEEIWLNLCSLTNEEIEEIWKKETQNNTETVANSKKDKYSSNKPILTMPQALSWWNQLTFEDKFYRVISWLKSQNRDTTERHPDDLTNIEILEIWKNQLSLEERESYYGIYKSNEKQYSQEEVDELLNQQAAKTTAQVLKSNQKQFKQFDESLFKAYIDKFSDEDKLKAFQILAKELYSINYRKGSVDNLLIEIGTWK